MSFTKKQLEDSESLTGWQLVMECLSGNKNKDYFDRLAMLQKRFSIKERKCKCNDSSYDVNGHCIKCDLKIKQK